MNQSNQLKRQREKSESRDLHLNVVNNASDLKRLGLERHENDMRNRWSKWLLENACSLVFCVREIILLIVNVNTVLMIEK
jgi:hypothetical protein